jgi:hypothetical protein
MIRRLAGLAISFALPITLLAACHAPPPPAAAVAGSSRADQATAAYCRQRAEEVYLTQNRDALYRTDNRDSPFAGAYVPSVTSRGLSDRYAQDRMIADCIRNTGERTNPSHTAPATPATGSSGSGAGPIVKAPPPPRP